ncbi:MAG: alanine racemase [Ruminococcaceae bacterium]|nr:alanine racemase [Oscillospiraceae bacterium]
MAFLHRTWAEINSSALIHNYNTIKNTAKECRLISVVKADAYGHGTDIVVPALLSAGADFFAVSNIDEAVELRSLNVDCPILILGYTPPEAAESLFKNNIIQTVYDTDYARKLSVCAKKAGVTLTVHIKLDTGMGRIGFNCRENALCGIDEAINCLNLENLNFEGVFTHFSSADFDNDYTEKQFALFMKATQKIKNSCSSIKIVHCCNSAGLLSQKNKHLNACRPGIILYGLTPDKNMAFDEKLIPAMTLKSVVSMVKEVEADTFVSYSKTFKADKKMRLATISVGYADGYPRALSNKGRVLINGKFANIVGRVCMDQTIVDVSHIDNVNIGDEVILFGQELPVDEIAEICNTINYEIVCGISKRVPRIDT